MTNVTVEQRLQLVPGGETLVVRHPLGAYLLAALLVGLLRLVVGAVYFSVLGLYAVVDWLVTLGEAGFRYMCGWRRQDTLIT